MWCGAVDYILILAFLTGSVLSHQTKNNGRVIANNSLEFRTSPTDEMTTLINTQHHVYHMEPDLQVPGNILFSEYCTLRTTDGIATTTLAGSSEGNMVAIGQLARFQHIFGFRQISATHVVVVDYNSHCLRLVDRLTLQTPWYAGCCGSYGYSQGTTSARFSYPRGIIIDKKQAGMLLVADHHNGAIRHVQITVGSGLSAVSQFYRSSTLNGQTGLTQDPIFGDLYVTTIYGGDTVYKLTYATRSLTFLAGSSSGFADGDFESSRFGNPSEIIIIENGRKLMLSDWNNHRLRLLDLITHRTSSLCTGQRGHSDGDMSSCTLMTPYSLMVLNNTLYVGEHQRIRKIQDYDDCSSSPCASTGTCEDQVDGFICVCQAGYDGTLCNNNIDDCSPDPCVHGTCTDGVDSFSCTCDAGYEGRLCAIDTDECSSSPCASTGTCEDQVDGFICYCEAGYDGTLCNSNIDDCSPNPCAHGTCTDGVNTFSCSCDAGYEGRLCGDDIDDCSSSPCASTGTCADQVDGFICLCEAGYDGTLCNNNIDACSPNPCVHGTCTDGVNTFSCSCDAGYEGRLCCIDHPDYLCSNKSIRQSASPDTGLAVVDLAQLGLEGHLTLPPGNYPYSIRTELQANCTVDIGVADHRLRRRLVFQSQYDVRCEVPEGNIADAPLTLIVARHAFDNSGICETDCTRPDDVNIELDCTNHTLAVVWPSNITYTGDVNMIPAELEDRLTTRIVAKGSLFYLFLPELNPPIAFPQEEENGGHMITRLSSYCVGENVNYVKVTDSCEEKTVDIPEM